MAQDRTVFNLTTLQCIPGGVAAVLEGIHKSLVGPRAPALLGCWISEIGSLNEIVVLRSFPSAEALDEQAFGEAELAPHAGAIGSLVGLDQGLFASFPGLPVHAGGKLGGFYEIRTYALRDAPQALPQTIAAWQEAAPGRVTLSPLVAALQSLSGPPRIVHIWPFETLDQRQAVRADAFQKGLWPPRGSLQWLDGAKSSIYIPAPFSPLR
ncbi:NIPSNAP family protein [Variovorax sp. UC122_21]|uniref:NIPSNAP family protein n=1 Tax=Variovorax sp. UC122_21 TaxID=3374554 RepID=UPI00375762D6